MLSKEVNEEQIICILIAADQIWNVVKNEIICYETEKCLDVVNTYFDRAWRRPVFVTNSSITQAACHLCVLETNLGIDNYTSWALEQFWELESIGLSDEGETLSEHDNKALIRLLKCRMASIMSTYPWSH